MTKNRNGSARRRQLEFSVLVDQVRDRKADLIERLTRNVKMACGFDRCNCSEPPMIVPALPVGPLLCSGQDACVVWTGAKGANGYGRINFWKRGHGHVAMRPHVVALILMLGRPIAKGHEAGHTCGNRLCIRHVEEQRWEDNLSQRDLDQARKAPGLDVPF